MAQPDPSRFRRRCRAILCRVRLCSLLLILLLLSALLYLNQAGLPGFIKEPILENLRTRGVNLQFSRLRWRWEHGFVAENVHCGGTNEAASVMLTLKEVQVRFSHWALARLQFQVDSLLLRQGRLSWSVTGADGALHELVVDGLQTELRFGPEDTWELDRFRARFAGAEIQLAGAITNASAISAWPFLRSRQPAAPGSVTERLQRFAETLERVHFTRAPELVANLYGDARDLRSFVIHLNLDSPDASTPWGSFYGNEFSLRLEPANDGEPACAEVRLYSAGAQTPWGGLTNLALSLHAFPPKRDSQVVHADLDLAAADVDTHWGRAAGMHFQAEWSHTLAQPEPIAGRGELTLSNVKVLGGSVRQARLKVGLSTASRAAALPDDSWAWWERLAPFDVDWDCRLNDLQVSGFNATELSGAGLWRTPVLAATQLGARLYGGQLDGQASVNVASRELTFTNTTDFDLQKISPLLTPKSREWLGNFSWEKPPKLRATGALILPAWTNRHPDWRGEVKPTIRLDGYVYLERGSFRGVQVTTADTRFQYTNEVWRLPDLVATRPEGRLNLALESDEKTRDYHFRIFSTLDPRALRPILKPNQQRGFDLIGINQPPVIEGEVWGRWYDYDRIGARARLMVTNFTVHGQSADSLQCALEYSNRILRVIEPRMLRAGGSQQLSASSVVADFNTRQIFLTNGFGKADPLAVARAIGPHIGQHLEPYHFLDPPTARVEGVIPMFDAREGDLHFDVDAGAFECWKFKVPRIKGRVDWVKDRLQLNQLQADFYRGKAWGNAEFDFSPSQGADFHFDVVTTNTDLHSLMNDLSAKTNQLEGVLDAQLNITHANTRDWLSWQGDGRVDVHDGLFWDIPLFGILSPVLNAVMPGMGNSRAGNGDATFSITNSLIVSDDMQIRTSLMRLNYRGTVDFKGNVNARVEAELMRNTWMIGPILSTALWPVSKMLMYKVTGTLHDPRREPLILTPFHQTKTYKPLTLPSPLTGETNAPPETQP